jgi:isopentenyldiphosphate isomerase
VVHVVVRNKSGELLMQLRSKDKDIQPDKWDTSVGGHIHSGEEIPVAVVRETKEEIGLKVDFSDFEFCYKYIMKNNIESELVHTYTIVCDEPFKMQEEEISELKFMGKSEIESKLGKGIFTPNFEDEYNHFKTWLKNKGED